MTYLEESKKRFEEEFGETIMDTAFVGTRFHQWTVFSEIKDLLASEISRFADEVIEMIDEVKVIQGDYGHISDPSFKNGLSKAQEILSKMKS